MTSPRSPDQSELLAFAHLPDLLYMRGTTVRQDGFGRNVTGRMDKGLQEEGDDAQVLVFFGRGTFSSTCTTKLLAPSTSILPNCVKSETEDMSRLLSPNDVKAMQSCGRQESANYMRSSSKAAWKLMLSIAKTMCKILGRHRCFESYTLRNIVSIPTVQGRTPRLGGNAS